MRAATRGERSRPKCLSGCTRPTVRRSTEVLDALSTNGYANGCLAGRFDMFSVEMNKWPGFEWPGRIGVIRGALVPLFSGRGDRWAPIFGT